MPKRPLPSAHFRVASANAWLLTNDDVLVGAGLKPAPTGAQPAWSADRRVAMRQGSTLYYLLGDHGKRPRAFSSTSVTLNSSGGKVAELRYRPYGETRYTNGSTPTSFRFTGQRSEMDGIGLPAWRQTGTFTSRGGTTPLWDGSHSRTALYPELPLAQAVVRQRWAVTPIHV